MNYKERILTPSEINQLDPTGNIRNFLNTIPRDGETRAEMNPFILNGAGFLETVANDLKLLGSKHQAYIDYSQEMISKCGRQGGAFAFSKLQAIVATYYELDCTQVEIPQQMYRARDYLISLIKEKIEQVGRPQLHIPPHYDTFAAIPTGISKGSFHSESLGVNKISIQKFFPTTPGQRRMRNKDRGIFMDANPNVRAQERYLTGARIWLKSNFPEFFGSWVRDDIYVRPAITRAVDRRSVFFGGDYKSMDVRFSLKVAIELVYPIYEVLFPDYALTIGSHIEQNFNQEIFWGDRVWSGLHSLLSGAGITNDFETIYTVILNLAAAIENQQLPAVRLMLALGDDMLVAYRTKLQAERHLDTASQLTERTRMIFSSEKTSITEGDCVYCRKVYYPSARRDAEGVMYGAYPSVLAVNNIVQPEKPIFKEPTSLVADLQRLDNLVGAPDYASVCQRFAGCNLYSREIWKSPSQLAGISYSDWWERLYGERWKPESSASLARVLPHVPAKMPKG